MSANDYLNALEPVYSGCVLSAAAVKDRSSPWWEDLRRPAVLQGIVVCCGGSFQRTCRGVKTQKKFLIHIKIVVFLLVTKMNVLKRQVESD